jgi:cytochrome P450
VSQQLRAVAPVEAVPGPRGTEALRWWWRLSREPAGTYLALQRSYGDLVRLPYRRGKPFLLLNRPDLVEHLLVTHQDGYQKAVTYRPLQAFLGSGLLTSEGELWQRHRRLIQPVFARRHVVSFAGVMAEAARRSTDRWRDGDVVDVAAQMRAITLDVVGQALFGSSLGADAERIGAAMARVQTGAMVAMLLTTVAPERTRWSALLRLPGIRGAATDLDQIVGDIVSSRRREGPSSEAGDLLDLLITARDADGSGLTDAEIRDEVLTLMLAGHETTANALTWTLALLSMHPEARDVVEQEVRDLPAAVTADDVEALAATAATVSESMRLYPPAWAFEREAIRPDVIDGYAVTPGTTVGVSPYVLHRHPDLWPDPERFDPARFLQGVDRSRYAYIPFGGGRRICVGSGFATLEATAILAVITQGFRLDLVEGALPQVRPEVTLSTRGPVLARVSRRR